MSEIKSSLINILLGEDVSSLIQCLLEGKLVEGDERLRKLEAAFKANPSGGWDEMLAYIREYVRQHHAFDVSILPKRIYTRKELNAIQRLLVNLGPAQIYNDKYKLLPIQNSITAELNRNSSALRRYYDPSSNLSMLLGLEGYYYHPTTTELYAIYADTTTFNDEYDIDTEDLPLLDQFSIVYVIVKTQFNNTSKLVSLSLSEPQRMLQRFLNVHSNLSALIRYKLKGPTDTMAVTFWLGDEDEEPIMLQRIRKRLLLLPSRSK